MFAVGIDIQDIEAFRKRTIAEQKKFYERLFTPAEIEYCVSKADPAIHFAARFAAKEAVMKAVGARKISQRYIEVVIEPGGKPAAVLLKKNVLPDGHSVEISISHSALQAAAVAMVHPV
jgi:holo-[acyl-carrier protein] synthase